MSVVEEVNTCPECGAGAVVVDAVHGERYCEACGLIFEANLIDRGPEWREFESGTERSRVGNPMTYTLHDRGLSTEIDRRNVDASGKSIGNSSRIRRMRTLHNRSRLDSSRQRNLMIALTELNKLASKMNIPRQTREEAALIYRRAVKKSLIRGRSIMGIMVSALYIACRQRGAARSLEEFCQASGLSKKEVGRNVRVLLRNLEIRSRPTSAKDFIPKIVSDLGLPHEIQSLALDLIEQVEDRENILGKSPLGIAGSVIYILSIREGQKRTQSEISKAIGITEVTLRNTYREIMRAVGDEWGMAIKA